MKRTIADVTNCTGCGGCKNICPHKAISMKVDSEGFLYPKIEADECVNCGICFDYCPSEHPSYINAENPECWAVAANDELRQQSSSGAVFPLLAEYILDFGGCVCGAAWNENNLIEHIIITDKADLHKLKGSKYLQSDTKDIYEKIKELLEQGKMVLFSGTPCQVAGLNMYLRKPYDNLLTIGLVCHGVPSPKVYKKYLSELVKNSDEKVIATNFRDKIKGWSPYLITTTTSSLSTYTFPAEQDVFMNAFIKNLCLRDACGQCPFAKFPRQEDITLGDFWGINKYSKKLDDKKGLSLVLINSPKGKKYIQLIKEQSKVLHKVPIKYAIKGNPCLVGSSVPHKNRKDFFERLDKMSLKDNVDIALGKKYDCAVLNLWSTNNYGALLTCWALQTAIKKLGFIPKIINYVLFPFKEKFTNGLSDGFAQKYLDLTERCCKRSDLRKLNEQTDTFIVGSDQVWRGEYFARYMDSEIFYLNFVRGDKKKIAYAASFGKNKFSGDYYDIQAAKYYLQRFDNISVREDDGVDICNNVLGVEARHVLDPVFLVEANEYDKLIAGATLNEENFVASYVLDETPLTDNLKKSVKNHFRGAAFVDMTDGQKGCSYSVENWLYAVKNCQFFITDSFHGACFAMIFNKPFVCILNSSRGNSRFMSLCRMFEIYDQCIANDEKNISEDKLFKPLNYKKINDVINYYRKSSKEWLFNALMQNKNLKEECDVLELIEHKISINNELIQSLLQINKLKRRCFRYNLLSKILLGKKRKKYKQKYKDIKKRIKTLKKCID